MTSIRPRTLAICVATHRRPHTLARLLDALAVVEAPPGCALELRVVDNDPARSAAAAVDAFAHRVDAVRVRYAVEPRPGVAAVRNAALDLGPADLVAFIDDDEWPTQTWLVDLVAALDAHDADAAVGPVVAALDDAGPVWRRPRFRGAPCAEAGRVPWVAGRTGNALVCGAWFFARGFRFDEDFAFTGGEDADLFSRLDEAGAVIVASRATVYEHVDVDRLSLLWLLERQRQQGMNFERIKSRRKDARPKVLRSGGHLVRIVVAATRAAGRQLVDRRVHDERNLEVALRAAWWLGLLSEQLRLAPSHHYGREP
jgi:succinoglycan biosynthesis protein ExoM